MSEQSAVENQDNNGERMSMDDENNAPPTQGHSEESQATKSEENQDVATETANKSPASLRRSKRASLKPGYWRPHHYEPERQTRTVRRASGKGKDRKKTVSRRPTTPKKKPKAVTPTAIPTKKDEMTKSKRKKQPNEAPFKKQKQQPLDSHCDSKEAVVDEVSSSSLDPEDDDEDDNNEDNGDAVDIDPDDGDAPPPSKFLQCQKVLARDEDGLLYTAFIRRSLYGVHHHKQVQVGMVASQQEMEEELKNQGMEPSWHYFVHYQTWKVNWDRWVTEDDILERSGENLVLAQRIMQEHRQLQNEFKQQNKRKVIDGGNFLKVWRQRLKKLTDPQGQDANKDAASSKSKKNPKKRKRSEKLRLEQEYKLRTRQSLSIRPPEQAQQVSLSFGLKRVMVEEWEIITQFRMLHALPAKVTIRQALDQYLESKGVKRPTPRTKPEQQQSDSAESMDVKASGGTDEVESGEAPKVPSSDCGVRVDGEGETLGEEAEQRNKDWLDMANGICMLFDQALAFRLLYPPEQAQLAVLEASETYADVPKSELYGCEHLLRLLCQLPGLLQDVFSNENSENDDQTRDNSDLLKSILAKVNDLARFLQKHQSTLFGQSYRKKTATEVQQEQKLVSKRRQHAKRKRQKLLQEKQIQVVEET